MNFVDGSGDTPTLFQAIRTAATTIANEGIDAVESTVALGEIVSREDRALSVCGLFRLHQYYNEGYFRAYCGHGSLISVL